MQYKKDTGQEGCTKVGIQGMVSMTGGMQNKRNSRQEGCSKGGIQDRWNARQVVCRTGRMQENSETGNWKGERQEKENLKVKEKNSVNNLTLTEVI